MLVKKSITPFPFFSGTLRAKADEDGFFLQGGGKIPLEDKGFEAAFEDPRCGEDIEGGWRLALWESGTYDSFEELLSEGTSWWIWKDVEEDVAYAECIIQECHLERIGTKEGCHFQGVMKFNLKGSEELKFIGWVNTSEDESQYLRISPFSGAGRRGKAVKDTWGAKPKPPARKRRSAA